ncbi:23S rRNA pseudouridine(955/2504/2580) synthase RluC [Pantoea sp. SoEX]|uniref:23S rRNA pseudouridine(955/2504/2580) synthase RluC n=1 Tax=Pantoea sp. SoEX TaxID=2576763 RepID=UPI00135708E9|nr:23S rRNA pseudouridine(955/2504/2580) synthase RluC [Pantoea sp. SoEX]MXP51005.1 23S rRNA pseudouridine(955/2504/2580) synthase RluC [Pantoea sp. SoEX]
MKNKHSDINTIIITNRNLNQRIDNFLNSKFKKIPKSFIYKILRKGKIKVNKKRVKPLYKLKINDEISIISSYLYNEHKTISNIKKNKVAFLNKLILYEDDYIIVINKPSGVAVHGGSGLSFGVIEGLRSLRSNCSFLELVHRLDRSTSGLLLIAKKRSALKCLHEQLRNRFIKKDYLALVHGIWPSNLKIINAPLKKQISLYSSSRSMVYVDINGKPSETYFQVKEYFRSTTLLKVRPITGHTHQIRVHAMHAGYPILFDGRYGKNSLDNQIDLGLNRLFLHAHALTFLHPKTGVMTYLEAPLDTILIKCLTNLSLNKIKI